MVEGAVGEDIEGRGVAEDESEGVGGCCCCCCCCWCCEIGASAGAGGGASARLWAAVFIALKEKEIWDRDELKIMSKSHYLEKRCASGIEFLTRYAGL